MSFHINHKKIKRNIDPDEIFLDSENLPNFNTQQFEGRLEKPISKRVLLFVGIFFILIVLIFVSKLVSLQITNGQKFLVKSQNNILKSVPIIAPRGLIYDRNNNLLVWNSWDNDSNTEDNSSIPKRDYIDKPGFSLLLGYTSSPAKDNTGHYWQDTFIGKAGVEAFYNKLLSGTNGVKITETNVKGKIQSQNIVSNPIPGQNLKLTIDTSLETELYKEIKNMAQKSHFVGGAGIIMNIKNGNILALTSYPEYNSNILSDGSNVKQINKYFKDPRKVFLNRAISGLYAPGSIVKPFIGYAALKEKIITPLKKILANGFISIPNPYFPDKKSVFKDHGVFGNINIEKAIAISSDVFFYELGGGYKSQPGLGINKINEYANMFGISQRTGVDLVGEVKGVIPNPTWKAKTFDGARWMLGDTYHSSIGQYGFLVTPIQMVRAVAGIANFGKIPTPHVRMGDDEYFKSEELNVPVNVEDLKVIQSGMHMAVLGGTARLLNLSGMDIAAKTGTAQVGYGNTNTNSWIIGFYPYKNPKYAFAVLMDRGPKEASGNATYVMRYVLQYLKANKPQYLN